MLATSLGRTPHLQDGRDPVRHLIRKIPSIAWRDARIEELRTEVQGLRSTVRERDQAHRAEVTRLRAKRARAAERHEEALSAATELARVRAQPVPSYRAQLHQSLRQVTWEQRRPDSLDPRRGLARKLAMYRFAESHGVAVPEVYGAWRSHEEIAWSDLPDRFVLKADRGTSGFGVWPLQRVGGGFRQVGSDQVRPLEHYTRQVAGRATSGKLFGPYFAEELLEDPQLPGLLPPDIKVYAFRGEVGHVHLRRMERHALLTSAHSRFLGPDGEDLGQVHRGRPVDGLVDRPRRLGEIVDISRRLSAAYPAAFVRVDLFELPDRVVFGELTLHPGGNQVYDPEHDQRLGLLWEQAQAEMLHAWRTGRPPGLLHGDHPVRTPVPQDYLL